MQFNIWIFIWVIVSIALLSFSIWTSIILMRQKKSWREFAKKHKLRYKNASMMTSPQVSGVYNGYAIWMFTGEHESERGGANRKLTAIEVELESRMPVSGAIASGGMVRIVQEMGYSDEFVPNHKAWKGDYIVRGEDKYILGEYLSEERTAALCELMETKSFWVIFIFKGNDAILRIDTPEPFESEEKLTKTIDMLIEVAKKLELRKGEVTRLKTKKTQREESARVEIEDDALASINLELEDDESQKEVPVEANEVKEAPEVIEGEDKVKDADNKPAKKK